MTIPAHFKEKIIFFFQLLGYLVWLFPSRVAAQARRNIDPAIAELTPGTLVVANHQSRFDPFITAGNMPLLSILTLLPIRFPIDHKYMKKKRWQWLRLIGCYDIGDTAREKMIGLYRTRQYLRSGVTVFLFPEGQINRTGQIGELKRGIEFLIDENTSVLFVRLQGFHRSGLAAIREKRSIVFIVRKAPLEIKRHDISKILQIASPDL